MVEWPLDGALILRNTTGFALALTIGATLGLGLTWFSLRDGPISGAVDIGPWRTWPGLGYSEADPYGRAHLARTGDLPLGAGEGIAFFASRDSSGAPLEGACRYTIAPIAPTARWWSLAAYAANRRPTPNAAERLSFTSAEVTRDSSGQATVVTGPTAQPGDWLPTSSGRIRFVLHLYDTPLATGVGSRQGMDLPTIKAEGCE